MERITPTGWGKQRGEPVRQLGSARAVIEQMSHGGGVFIVGNQADAGDAEALIAELAQRRDEFTVISAWGGPDELYRIPPSMVIGVHPTAFAGVPVNMWADMQKILTTRFKRVIWG